MVFQNKGSCQCWSHSMSRSGSIAALLGDPELRVQAVAPSGDCFYEAIGIALASVGEDVGEREGETTTAALRRFKAEKRNSFCLWQVHISPPGIFLRMVADEVDQEVFDNFMAFHLAGLWFNLSQLPLRWKTNLTGLPDFSFMKRIRCVEDLKDRLQVLAAEWYIMMSINENENK